MENGNIYVVISTGNNYLMTDLIVFVQSAFDKLPIPKGRLI